MGHRAQMVIASRGLGNKVSSKIAAKTHVVFYMLLMLTIEVE